MKHYDSIPRIQDDGSLKGDIVWGFNKLDGQNFCVTFNCRKKTYGPYGSRNVTVDKDSDHLGPAVVWFDNSNYKEILFNLWKENSEKKKVFNGVEEITYFFEWYGDKSFAGKHVEGDQLHLALIDVFIKKKGYMEPEDYYRIYNGCGIEIPKLIYKGILDANIIKDIQENDWTQLNTKYPDVKEGVVFKRSTLLKGQNRPSVKVKTKWWLNKLHSMYSEEECKLLE